MSASVGPVSSKHLPLYVGSVPTQSTRQSTRHHNQTHSVSRKCYTYTNFLYTFDCRNTSYTFPEAASQQSIVSYLIQRMFRTQTSEMCHFGSDSSLSLHFTTWCISLPSCIARFVSVWQYRSNVILSSLAMAPGVAGERYKASSPFPHLHPHYILSSRGLWNRST